MESRQRLWWIASYPKSGSTWVRMVVNAYVSQMPPDINSAWQYATGDLQPQVYQLTAAAPIDQMLETDAVYYRPAVLLNHILTSPVQDKCLKTHHAKVLLDGMPLIPPRLSKGALYIVRDPRDIATSFAAHMGCSVDDAIAKKANNECTIQKSDSKLFHLLMSWSSHVDSWTIKNKDVRTTVVRYEDLLETPKRTWPLVLKGLGIDVDRQRLRRALEMCEFNKLQAKEQKNGFRECGKGEQFFRRGKAGGWKDELTADQARAIERNHRGTMQRWGYVDVTRNRLPRVQTAAVGSVK